MSPESPFDVILGSSSPRRIELLTGLGIDFRVVKPDVVEERHPNERAAPYTQRNARLKANRVASLLPHVMPRPVLIISADTIVVCEEDVLEKPVSVADAQRMLRALSGRQHQVLTGLCLALVQIGRPMRYHEEVIETSVTIKPLTDAEIHAYVATGEPMDKSGSYAIQGLGGYMVSRIDGSYSNVVGLPMAELVTALSSHFGVDLWRHAKKPTSPASTS